MNIDYNSQSQREMGIIDRALRLIHQDDYRSCIALCREGLVLYDQNSNPDVWAALMETLAICLCRIGHGDQIANITEAIQILNDLLEVYNREDGSRVWASLHNNLGNAYTILIPITEVNCSYHQLALHHYQEALTVYTQWNHPVEWASVQCNLGRLFHEWPGKTSQEEEMALHHCLSALEAQNPLETPRDWAATQHVLAAIYAERQQGTRAVNQELAINHSMQALSVLDARRQPYLWAKTHLHLGRIYCDHLLEDSDENTEMAMDSIMSALEVFKPDHFAKEWVQCKQLLASIYEYRHVGDRSGNLEMAIRLYQESLICYEHARSLEKWASCHLALGKLYFSRLKGDRLANLQSSIQHLNTCLEIYNKTNQPAAWHWAHFCLALAHRECGTEASGEHTSAAAYHYKLAFDSEGNEFSELHMQMRRYEDLYRQLARVQERIAAEERAGGEGGEE